MKHRLVWAYGHPDNNLDDVVPDNIMKEIGRLTGCKLVKMLNEQKIYVGSDAEELCHRAIHKLNNIRKYSVCGHSDFKV